MRTPSQVTGSRARLLSSDRLGIIAGFPAWWASTQNFIPAGLTDLRCEIGADHAEEVVKLFPFDDDV